MRDLRVYLCGGFHSDWQNEVREACKETPIHFINPKKNWVGGSTKTEEERESSDKKLPQSIWWGWDKLAIQLSDIIFVNLEDYGREEGNLRGTGDIYEMGMAWAYDKLIICVNVVDHRYYRGIARNHFVFSTMEEGIKALKGVTWIVED